MNPAFSCPVPCDKDPTHPSFHQVWDSVTSAYVSTPKAFGKSLQPAELPDGIARFFAPQLAAPSDTRTPAALPLPLLHSVLQMLLSRLRVLIELFSSLECRIRGGSVLIVVEGDATALAAALDRDAAAPPVETEDDDSEASSVSTTDEEGQAKPHTLVPVELRLIDFAHATKVDGQGPDEGVLLGLETTRTLLQGMLARVAEEMDNGP